MPVNGTIDAAKGTYRDNERFIQAAKDAGLWLIARFVNLFNSCL